MGKRVRPTFEQWIAFIFDQPLDVPTQYLLTWRRPHTQNVWELPPRLLVSYMTRAFEQASTVLAPFSDRQLRQGLWFLLKDNRTSSTDQCSDHLYSLYNAKVPWPERKRCLYAMYTLFEQLFAQRCSPHLSHLGEQEAHPLNVVCYTWWDTFYSISNSIYSFSILANFRLSLPLDAPSIPMTAPQETDMFVTSGEIDETIIAILNMVLNFESDACRESVLYGLRHAAGMYKQQYYTEVKNIIDNFLTHNSQLRPVLKTYALNVLEQEPKQLTHLSFEAWISYVFDHPVRDPCLPAWHFDMFADYWNETSEPEVALTYLTSVFKDANTLLMPFSDAQINQGFWFLINNACSNHMFTLMNTAVPWPKRKQCIDAMYTLFEQFFAQRCTAHLDHLNTIDTEITTESPLNAVCYMWWDIIPLYGKPDEPERAELDAACLDVMRKTLALDAIACQESALHGLGHWQYVYPDFVHQVIEEFLTRNHDRDPQLKEYALAARNGHIQ